MSDLNDFIQPPDPEEPVEERDINDIDIGEQIENVEDNIIRKCRKCGQEKPLKEFYRDPNCRYSRRHVCIACKTADRRTPEAKERHNNKQTARRWQDMSAYNEKAREYNKRSRIKKARQRKQREQELYDEVVIAENLRIIAEKAPKIVGLDIGDTNESK